MWNPLRPMVWGEKIDRITSKRLPQIFYFIYVFVRPKRSFSTWKTHSVRWTWKFETIFQCKQTKKNSIKINVVGLVFLSKAHKEFPNEAVVLVIWLLLLWLLTIFAFQSFNKNRFFPWTLVWKISPLFFNLNKIVTHNKKNNNKVRKFYGERWAFSCTNKYYLNKKQHVHSVGLPSSKLIFENMQNSVTNCAKDVCWHVWCVRVCCVHMCLFAIYNVCHILSSLGRGKIVTDFSRGFSTPNVKA